MKAHLALSLASLLLVIGCKRDAKQDAGKGNARRAELPSATASAVAPASSASMSVPAGQLVVGPRPLAIALYTKQPLAKPAITAIEALVKTRLPEQPLGAKDRPSAHVDDLPIADFAPPTPARIALFGRGLDAAQTQTASTARGALLLRLDLVNDEQHQALRKLEALTLEVARQHDAFVWDDLTRELFTPAAWEEQRIAGWEGDLPRITQHITIHYYPTDGDRHRAISLGMVKLGLPDLVIQDVPLPLSVDAIRLMNTAAQLLVEGAVISAEQELTLDLAAIRHQEARKRLSAGVTHQGKIKVRVEIARMEEGDPENRLIALSFGAFSAASEQERLGVATTALFGKPEDRVSLVSASDPEILAIGKRVQEKLKTMAPRLKAGAPVGESFSVKAPFDTDDGSVEWMWVSVTAWNGATLLGHLENEPLAVKRLARGAKVEVPQEKIADYAWQHADGIVEGGESARLLERRAMGQ